MVKHFSETNSSEGKERQNWLQTHKPYVYEKMQKFPEKIINGESVAIIQFQYNYQCNFKCEHCSIDKFQVAKSKETKKFFSIEDVRELSRQADEMGLAQFSITGGEPMTFKDYDKLVEAIDPNKFWIASDSNGWFLDRERIKHLKSIGVDKMQISIDGANPKSHDKFRNKKGSWIKIIKAIKECKEEGMPLILQTVVWKDRVYTKEWLNFLDMAKNLGVGTYISFAKPVGAYEGRFDQMLTEKEVKIIEEQEKHYDIFTHMTPSYGRDIGCIAVKRMISVTRYGDILPCPYTHVSLGNFFEEPLKDIVDRGLNIKWFDPKKKMPCICGVDKTFIDKVVSKTYGDVPVPVQYEEVFTDSDFLDKDNMGKVKRDPTDISENETYNKAPNITVEGEEIK